MLSAKGILYELRKVAAGCQEFVSAFGNAGKAKRARMYGGVCEGRHNQKYTREYAGGRAELRKFKRVLSELVAK